jgi:hypothetical protein
LVTGTKFAANEHSLESISGKMLREGTLMDAAKVLSLINMGPNAAFVKTLGGASGWNVAEDWGLSGWRVSRVPVGLKFERCIGLRVVESVVVVRGGQEERARQPFVPVPGDALTPHSRLTGCQQFSEFGRDD